MMPVSRQFARYLERRERKRLHRPGPRPAPKTPKPLKKPTEYQAHVHIFEANVLAYHFTKGWRYGRAA
jgi:hypothetical protein